MAEPKDWFVYIILSSDDSLYTGITTDVDRRFNEHMNGKAGARFFNGRKPVSIVYQEVVENRSVASIREAKIKKLSRKDKLTLIQSVL